MAEHHNYSRRSVGYLNKCEAVIRPFAERTLELTPFDISILKSTSRTLAQQKHFIAIGKSNPPKIKGDFSKYMHLPGISGKSRAVDMMPYIPGMSTQDLFSRTELFEEMHECAQIAAREMDLNIRSGITWSNLNTDKPMRQMLHAYRVRKYNQNRKPFFDGPHFELYRREYPSC